MADTQTHTHTRTHTHAHTRTDTDTQATEPKLILYRMNEWITHPTNLEVHSENYVLYTSTQRNLSLRNQSRFFFHWPLFPVYQGVRGRNRVSDTEISFEWIYVFTNTKTVLSVVSIDHYHCQFWWVRVIVTSYHYYYFIRRIFYPEKWSACIAVHSSGRFLVVSVVLYTELDGLIPTNEHGREFIGFCGFVCSFVS